MAAFRTLAYACLLALGSCTHAHDIEAVIIDGRLAFRPTPEMLIHARCVSRVEVMPATRTPPTEVKARTAWTRKTYAWLDHGGHDCDDGFPVFYGEALKGVGEGGALRVEVAPKPLETGVIYSVRITAGAAGYGQGRFRLLEDGTVENLPNTP